MNAFFKMPSYYQRFYDPKFQENVTALISDCKLERYRADQRLHQRAVKKSQLCDRTWILENYYGCYGYYDLSLTGYTAMLLEGELLKHLDGDTFGDIRSKLDDGTSLFSKLEIQTWFDDYICETHADQVVDLSWDGVSAKPKITFAEMYRVSVDISLVVYRNKRRQERIYIIGCGQETRLFEIVDPCGRLASESGFLFIQ